jgi:hypothetical protein
MTTVESFRILKHSLADAIYRLRTRALRRQPGRKRLVVFYLHADAAKYPDSLPALEQALQRLHGFDIDLMAIDNFNEDGELRQVSERRFQAPGDNSQWEFSGWKRGTRLFETLSIRPDLALFVNDSFLNRGDGKRDAYRFRSTFNSLSLQSWGNCALGHAYETPANHAIRGWRAGFFLQTHAFALPYQLVPRLRFTYWSDEELERLLPSTYCGEWFRDEDGRVSQEFQAFIIRYLTRDWHSARPFNAANWPVLRGKTIAMINERLFSQDVVDNGCPVVNATRLSVWRGTAHVERMPLSCGGNEPSHKSCAAAAPAGSDLLNSISSAL